MLPALGSRDPLLVPEFLFAIPGDLATPTGGYRYDRRIMEELKQFGWKATLLPLPGDFPSPSPKSLRETELLLDATPDDALILFDGLAYGALPADVLNNVPRRYVALVHHPLALETGLTVERVAEFRNLEREALARAIRVVATSQTTADILARDFGVPKDRISVAEPGTDPASRARGNSGVPRLLGVGAVTRRKGFDTLAAALERIKDIEWECHIVGSLDRDNEAVAQLKNQIAQENLGERIKLLGSVSDEELSAEYDHATLFVLPSHFEGYGMAFAEAIARGLPIVACAGGAVTKTVPQDAGVFVPAGDANALAKKLRWLLTNPGEIKKRADEAWYRAEKLPRWRDTAREIAVTLEKALA
jgi:glycosyltransferase involved in cell wall biosynthesis